MVTLSTGLDIISHKTEIFIFNVIYKNRYIINCSQHKIQEKECQHKKTSSLLSTVFSSMACQALLGFPTLSHK